MIVKKFRNDNSQDVRSRNFCRPCFLKNFLENNLAIVLDTDLKRGANLIDLTIIFINL